MMTCVAAIPSLPVLHCNELKSRIAMIPANIQKHAKTYMQIKTQSNFQDAETCRNIEIYTLVQVSSQYTLGHPATETGTDTWASSSFSAPCLFGPPSFSIRPHRFGGEGVLIGVQTATLNAQ